jgi:predicted dehydrogenase
VTETAAAPETGTDRPRTLVVGLGHSGTDLHLPVLDRLRRDRPGSFAAEPPVGCDPLAVPGEYAGPVVPSIARAAELLDPRRTVVHLCVPPAGRLGPLRELAEAGFAKVIVEKPLATGLADLAEITALRSRLDLVVVSQWLTSALTTRLAAPARHGSLGPLTAIRFTQRKARFRRSAGGTGHPTAFDVELPHSLGVALFLAGGARVTAARGRDLTTDGWSLPRLGGARVALHHHGGVRTELVSDLDAPVRERRVELTFDRGTVVGHYPVEAGDPYARLEVHTADGTRSSVFADDALSAFLTHAYRYFAGAGGPSHTDLNTEVVRLLCQAKTLAWKEKP